MRYSLLILLLLTLFGCQSSKIHFEDGSTKRFHTVKQYIKESKTLQSYFFGFELQNVKTQDVIYSYQSDNYFTPASNTKLLTLWAAINKLPDSLNFVRIYENSEGNKIYVPQGEPSFLYYKFKNQFNKDFFKHQPENHINLCIESDFYWRYGQGWAWDDYLDYYQVEKSGFPIAGNLVTFEGEHYFPEFLPIEYSTNCNTVFDRAWDKNEFCLRNRIQNDQVIRIPFHVEKRVFTSFFEAQNKTVQFVDFPDDSYKMIKQIKGESRDSVLKVLMQDSDNFIAEQLLLQISQQEMGMMNSRSIINKLKPELFDNLPDSLNWIDGSGLSRYNLFTPRSLTEIMNRIIALKGTDWVKEIFAAGGQSGTIKNYYAYSPSRVFAKTGTLRNNHCLTGLIETKKGNQYTFSMMNNHYPGSSAEARSEMAHLIQIIVDLY